MSPLEIALATRERRLAEEPQTLIFKGPPGASQAELRAASQTSWGLVLESLAMGGIRLTLSEALEIVSSHQRAGANIPTPLGALTPLQIACAANSPALIKALCQCGCDPSELNDSGISALSSAISLRRPSCADALMEAGACLDPICSPEIGLPQSAPEACRSQGLSGLAARASARLAAIREREAIASHTLAGSARPRSRAP